MNKSKRKDKVLLVFFVILLVCILFEVGLMMYASFNADRVECNLLWCVFTKERRSIEQNTECFVNGREINCSDFPMDEHFCYNGRCEVSGIRE